MKSKNFPYKNSREFQSKLINGAYLSLGIPLVVFLWVFLEFLNENIHPLVSGSKVYIILIGLAAAIAAFIWMAVKVFKNGIKLAKGEPGLKDKLIIYEKVSGRKFFFLFLASSLSVLGLYICASEIFAGLFFVVLFIFSMGSPTKDRIVRDLRLQDENRKLMLKEEEFSF